jgi:RNA polymerase sigma-70 factor (ECF subfamily)
VEQQKTALFEQIFYTTKDKVYAFIRGMVHDHTQVQDYMQSCYLKLWESMDKMDTATEVLPFLYTVSRNIVIDHLRKSSRIEYTEDIQHYASHLPGYNNTEYYLSEKESNRQVQELLELLPERRRQVFLLIKIEGLSYKEVAHVLQISVSTVEKHMHEAYKTISATHLSKALVCLLVMSHLP